MAPAAEIGEGAVVAEGNGAVFQILDQLRLVGVIGVFGQGIGLGHGAQLEFGLFAGKFKHLLLNFLKVTLAKSLPLEVHIVVESVLNGRANRQEGVGVKVKNGLRQNVRAGVPESRLPLGLVPGEED